MDDGFAALALFLLINLVAGLWRAARGPTAADRLVAAQILGTLGIGVLLLVAEISDLPTARDTALLLALFALLASVIFVQRLFPRLASPEPPDA